MQQIDQSDLAYEGMIYIRMLLLQAGLVANFILLNKPWADKLSLKNNATVQNKILIR